MVEETLLQIISLLFQGIVISTIINVALIIAIAIMLNKQQ